MPTPQPKPNETAKAFVARFMANEIMKKEYPTQDQRLAVAYSTFRRSRGKK